VAGNAGCGVTLKSAQSYGPEFNKAGGGWYVLERTPTEMRVWFWSRGDGGVPADVKNGAKTIDTSKFGTPGADFPSTSCDMKSHFGAHNIIINLTLCMFIISSTNARLTHGVLGGQWAGQTYNQNGCQGSCVGKSPFSLVKRSVYLNHVRRPR
jgi:hypothetical protein